MKTLTLKTLCAVAVLSVAGYTNAQVTLGADHLSDSKPSAMNAPVTKHVQGQHYSCDNEHGVVVRFLTLNQVSVSMGSQQAVLTKTNRDTWRTFGVFHRPTDKNYHATFSAEQGLSDDFTTWEQRGQSQGILNYHTMDGVKVKTHCAIAQ